MVVTRTLLLFFSMVLAGPCVLSAHDIYLKNGSVIKTNSISREGTHISYEQFGGVISISLSEVEQIVYEKRGAAGSQRSSPLETDTKSSQTEGDDLVTHLEEKLAPKTAIETANLSVVSIKTDAGSGSGFFVSDDGLIVTNRHVVRGSEINNRQVEDKISEAEDRLLQWRQTLDREKNRLDRYESRLKKNWASFRKAVKEQGERVDAKQRREVESSLKEKSSYFQEWRRDYTVRRNNYEAKEREVNRGKLDFHKKTDRLARQSRFTITLADGSEKSAILYRVSDTLDLALLKLNGYRTPHLRPADSRDSTLGQRVYAIGSPLQLNNSVTSGVISHFRGGYVQTNAEIYPGNSGGPLVTEDGLVLGVNTMKMITEKFEGLGFAIEFSQVLAEFKPYFN